LVVIERSRELSTLAGLLRRNPVVAIVGARQVGKTTLARQLAAGRKGPVVFFDLENPADVARLDDPLLALGDLKGLVVIDEVQRRPELFPVLRFLVDRPRRPVRFLVLGSAGPGLLRQSSESLAGRIVYHELAGLGLDEVGASHAQRLWLRGGFPRAFLARSNSTSAEWLRGFIRTFLERDIPQLGFGTPAATLYRFWMMLAHYHAQVWNASELGRSFGVADTTVRSYLDLLAGALVIRVLPPWFENLAKRQVRAPKVYIADSGLLHALLNLDSFAALETHPKIGASWEGFVIQQLIRCLGARQEECWFWATHSGAELDLLVVRGTRRYGFEVKRTSTPRMTPSMRSAITDLRLATLTVVHAGDQSFSLGSRVRAVALSRLLKDVRPLR
jgi:predicted AAA+ superfamily ATPase